MRSRIFAAGCALALGACVRPQPCGWDEQLAEGATYDVSLVERYAPGETTTFYTPDLDLTRPAETCAMLDEIAVGLDAQVRLVEEPGAAGRCSVWAGELVAPTLDVGETLRVTLNDRWQNLIIISGRRDFGGGCEGVWELTLHAPRNDPFEAQTPGDTPVVTAYRVFEAVEEASAACSALVGREPSTGPFRCGDAFVATMSRR